MDKNKIILDIHELHKMMEIVKNMDIPKISIQKITKCLDFEIYMIEREIHLSLGKEEYKKIKNKCI